MTIARKPKTNTKKLDEKAINLIINKGGSTVKNEKPEEKPVILRVPADTLEQIDGILKNKKIKTPRHTWLLEAVYEKLEREV